METKEPSEQETAGLGELVKNKDEETNKRKGYGQLSQSRSAILIAVIIILIIDFLAMLFWVLQGETSPQGRLFRANPFIFSIVITAIELLPAIYLLLGKQWARIWMLIRMTLGITVGGIFSLVIGGFPILLINTGLLLAPILLLTGVSTRLRLVGSVTLAVVAALVGMVWTVMPPLTTLPKTPETAIPESFSTHTSEGFFSISYPPDWVPVISDLEELEKEVKLYSKSLGLESQLKDMQIVFTGWKDTEDGDVLFVAVQVQPKEFLPLDTLVETSNQWAEENMEQYVEYSRVATTIGERKAIIQTYQHYDDRSVLMKFTTSYVVGEEFMWIVVSGCNSQGFDVYSDTFDNIVRSLRVEY